MPQPEAPATTAALVRDFAAVAPADLYRLYADVYASSDGMSETFAEKYPSFESFADDLGDLGRRPGAVALAAVADERPQAYCTLRPRLASRLRHTADLALGVAGAMRGRGLGRRVLAAALDRARADGRIEIVYLMVRADNRAAIRLYAWAGFETLAVLDRDIRVGDAYRTGLLMRCRPRG